MQLKLPGLTVRDAKVALTPPINCRLQTGGRPGDAAGYVIECMGVYPMHLGRNVLQQLRLYVATREKMLYFTAAERTSASASTARPLVARTEN